jgi:hypothetical protein
VILTFRKGVHKMKTVIHTKETFQNGSFDLDRIAFIEQNEDHDYVIVLKGNDENEDETHIYRSTCVLVFERNFHSMILKIG